MICDGCGTDFTDDVELFPKLLITKDERMARKLAEKRGDGKEEMLCITCWLQALQMCEKDALGMLLLGMLRRQRGLENEISRLKNKSAINDIIEKSKQNQWSPVTAPSPVWYHDQTIYTAPHSDPADVSQVWCMSKEWSKSLMESFNAKKAQL